MTHLSGPGLAQEIEEAAKHIAKRTGQIVEIAPGVVASPSGNVIRYCLCEVEDGDHPECPIHGGGK